MAMLATDSEVENPPVGATFPEKLALLFRPARYKVVYGGRGAAKSWGFARALLIQGAKRKLRVLCAREYQNSIADSVHQLLSDQINALGLQHFYKVHDHKIEGINSTKFRFFGMRRQFEEIASFEGVDICWVEEANKASRASWAKLIPTIRKDGSEIWISFNPELDTDETYKRFVIKTPPDAIVEKMTWQDNPFFPEVLNKERLYARTQDQDEYMHVWEGACKRFMDGTVFAVQLREAEAATPPRITRVPYERGYPVDTAWDLGRSDATSIWFRQRVGMETRVIDFYENSGEDLPHYLEYMQKLPYVYGHHYLPHDGKAKRLGQKYTVEEQCKMAFGNEKVHVLPQQSVADQINAARMYFSQCWFDEERCADGLQHLRHYAFDIDPHTRQVSKNPKHDEHSHAGSAFQGLAMSKNGTRDKIVLRLDQQASAEKRRVLLDMKKLTENTGWLNG